MHARGFLVSSLRSGHFREAMSAGHGVWVVTAQQALAIGQHVLMQALGFLMPSLLRDHFGQGMPSL